jgi:hypothetical protein
MRTLTRLMLKEEFRMHTSHSSRAMFYAFPFLIMIMAFGSAMSYENILQFVGLREIILGMHIGSFFYGLSVGAFGFMGREYIERQHGYRNYLVATPKTLPLRFRTTFFGLYVRDVIYYFLIILIPITGGLLLSVPFTHFKITSILLLFLAVSLSFLIGISLSFFVSVLYIRSTVAFISSVVAISAFFVAYGVFDMFPLESLIPGLGFQSYLPPLGTPSLDALTYLFGSLALVLVFTTLATLMVPTVFEPRKSKPEEQRLPKVYARFQGFRKYGMLLSKELVDLRRSGTVTKMFFSFVVPLLFLNVTTWLVNYGLALPVDFNIVFYGGMVGLFGVILYSWLNNVDIMDYFNTMPVTVPQVIRTKLIAFLILTSGISTVFVIGIALINNQLSFLWLALPVMLIVSVYVVVAIAYLTGLRTNNLLFDTGIMARFYVLSFLPIICLDILSFTIGSHYLIAIFGIFFVVFVLSFAAFLFYRGIEEKWGRSDFLG